MERAFSIYQISNFSGLSAGGMHPPFLFFLKKRNGPCTVQREIALAQNGALRLFCLRRLVERDGAVQTWLLSAGCAGQGARAGLRRRIWGLGCMAGVVIARLSATSPAAAALALPDDSNEKGTLIFYRGAGIQNTLPQLPSQWQQKGTLVLTVFARPCNSNSRG